MELDVRVFGGLTERVGASRTRLTLAEGATVGQLRDAIATAHPSVAGLLPSVKVAVDLEIAGDDVALTPDSEVALLPPVAGGAGDVAGAADGASTSQPDVRVLTTSDGRGVRTLTGLRPPPFDVDTIVAQVAAPDAGGTVVFLGTVRDHSGEIDAVTRLDYSAYPEMADRVLADIASGLAADHPELRGIALLHAVGELPVGAHTVLIVCASPHRAEAFAACSDGLERVKDHVPIWKRELAATGDHRWVGLEGAPDDRPPRG